MGIRSGAWFLLLAGAILGQTSNNQTLNGKYYFRHLLFTTDGSGSISAISSLWGAINFDGSGNYTFNGQSATGRTPPAALSGSGTYSVSAADFVTLTNPQNKTLTLNARWGQVTPGANTLVGRQPSEAMLIGSSTEGAGNTFDLFIAIQAAQTSSNGSLSGSYFTATLAFASGAASEVSSAVFSMQANAQGGFSNILVNGHAANLAAGAPTTQTIAGASYMMQADGSGSAAFPLQPGLTSATQMLGGNKTIYVSSGGNVILGGSNDGSTQDMLVGFKSGNGLAWTGEFWHAGLRYESTGSADAYSGSLAALSNGKLIFTRRLRQLQASGAITYDFTGTNAYTLRADGSGTAELTQVALGAAGNGFVGAALNLSDSAGYELYLGVSVPKLSGTGVFLNPLGVVDAASFAPAGDPISPGEFIALFGTGLSASTQTAAAPYSTAGLAGVTVAINNVAAPVQYVSATRLNVLVPYATQGTTATIVVNNNGVMSNAVEVPVAPTAPGVFTVDTSGTGPGAILHANYSPVTSASPAKAGETVLIYLTGLGVVNPAVPDGTAGGANPTSKTTAPVSVLIDGILANVSYSGLAPLFPGLYQINVEVPVDLTVTACGPVPLAIQTPDSFHDQVDLIVGP